MTYADRWLLPDGVEEILPGQAQQIEQLRRQLLDLYRRWGYDFVIPPLMEFTDSLLIGMGSDLDLLTFKVTDQLSGRMLGIRADITPQAARMDAHSLKRDGANRLCYAGHVLFTKPKAPLATRSPIMSGVELFGEASINADLEVLSLLLESLDTVGLSSASIELGHVAIFRAIAEAAQLSDNRRAELFDMLQRKALTELSSWIESNIRESKVAQLINVLPTLAGDRASLVKAREKLADAPAPVLDAIGELENLADRLLSRYPQARLYFDLSEPHSFNYHTGLVFSVFAPGLGRALASGGRYDDVGEVFGRARPATGFSIDVTTVNQLLNMPVEKTSAIFVESSEDPVLWEFIQTLRSKGEVVICGFTGDTSPPQRCDRRIENVGGKYTVVADS
ncbi:ATP phosphoribosyltransferase regulatory subunit [Aurantivibrio plasticivorans]